MSEKNKISKDNLIFIKEYLKRALRSTQAFEPCELTLDRDDMVALINLLNERINDEQ